MRQPGDIEWRVFALPITLVTNTSAIDTIAASDREQADRLARAKHGAGGEVFSTVEVEEIEHEARPRQVGRRQRVVPLAVHYTRRESAEGVAESAAMEEARREWAALRARQRQAPVVVNARRGAAASAKATAERKAAKHDEGT
jgi:hypothetical protein